MIDFSSCREVDCMEDSKRLIDEVNGSMSIKGMPIAGADRLE